MLVSECRRRRLPGCILPERDDDTLTLKLWGENLAD